jgi:hypothetical protein
MAPIQRYEAPPDAQWNAIPSTRYYRTAMPEKDVALDLFLRWLNDAHERPIAIEVRPLLGPVEDADWLAARERIEQQIADAVPAPIAVWVPAGADLPAGEPQASAFVEHVRQAAVKLGPHERAHIPLPITIFLRKTVDSGSVVSVLGGLNPHWARFTERVRGTFDLDSTRLHRLPESEEHLETLIDKVIERSERLEAGQWAEIETIDAWTVQRLAEGAGTTLVAVPASEASDMGLAVRRNLRRILGEAVPSLRDSRAEVKALVLLGYYPRIEDEGASIAMRGFSPALYSGVDFVILIADGLVKPLIQPSIPL